MTKELNRIIIRSYFDLGLMCIDGKVYAELKDNLHVSTIVRIPKKPNMRSNTVTVFYVKINNFPLEESVLVQVNSKVNNCFIVYLEPYKRSRLYTSKKR